MSSQLKVACVSKAYLTSADSVWMWTPFTPPIPITETICLFRFCSGSTYLHSFSLGTRCPKRSSFSTWRDREWFLWPEERRLEKESELSAYAKVPYFAVSCSKPWYILKIISRLWSQLWNNVNYFLMSLQIGVTCHMGVHLTLGGLHKPGINLIFPFATEV